jgi:hypothetical protein
MMVPRELGALADNIGDLRVRLNARRLKTDGMLYFMTCMKSSKVKRTCPTKMKNVKHARIVESGQ